MIKKTYLLILVMLFTVPGLMAQAPTVTIGDVQAEAGEILVPVYMENFENLATIDLAIDIDTQVLTFVDIVNLADETPGVAANFDGTAIKIGWFDSTGDGVDLDGKFLELKLEYTGGFETMISFIEDECEIGDAFFGIFENVEYVPGTISQDPDTIDGHVSMATLEADVGDVVHMPVTFEGEGFEEVGAFELFIEVDPDQIDFGEVIAQSDLAGLSGAEVEDGLIKITWATMTDEDFSDETHVADLVVTYKGGGPAQLRFTGESRVTSGAGNYLSVLYTDGMVVMEDIDARLNITDQVYQFVEVDNGDDMDDVPTYAVPVTVESITDDVYAINISIAFDDEQVEYETVEFAQLEGWSVAAADSSVDFTWSNEDGASLEDGDLLVLHFVLPEGAEEAQSDLNFRGGTHLLGEAANYIPVALDHGSLTVTEVQFYTVTFNVVDEADEPIDDAVVTLNGIENEPGDYIFDDIAAGTYNYTVEKEGFLTYEGEIEVEEDTTVDVVLVEDDPVVEVGTLAELRDMADDGTIYMYTGEAVITAMDDFRNRKFIQDATAAILIDDDPGIITTEYDLYDVITNVVGQVIDFNGMIQFQPEENTDPATDNTPIDPVVFLPQEVTMDDQAKLITLENMMFVDVEEGDVFQIGQNYEITDGTNDFILRTDFFDADYIGEEMPHGEFHVSGVILYHFGELKIIPRFAADIEIVEVETFEVTFFADLSLAIEYELLDGFDPDQHHILITGEMFEWAEPFADNEDQVLEKVEDNPLTYAITLHLEAGEYAYKYFSDLLGEGWDGGEWDAGDDRMVEVTEDMEVYDYFGYRDEELSATDMEDVEMSIYPIPANTNVTIESNAVITELRVVDMLGQVVFSSAVNDNRYEINVSNFKNGVYFMQMTTTAGVITHRIQVAK